MTKTMTKEAAMTLAAALLRQYRDYAEAMRTHGRGFVPTADGRSVEDAILMLEEAAHG